MLNALSGAGQWLVQSGKAIIDGLISGIKGAISGAKDAVSGALQSIRDLFPFSPAKEGPFSGRGWVLYSGRSITAAFAQGVTDNAWRSPKKRCMTPCNAHRSGRQRRRTRLPVHHRTYRHRHCRIRRRPTNQCNQYHAEHHHRPGRSPQAGARMGPLRRQGVRGNRRSLMSAYVPDARHRTVGHPVRRRCRHRRRTARLGPAEPHRLDESERRQKRCQ